jgi:nucleotide-binding universal stress UspA family protein
MEGAQRMAEQGADLARQVGREAEGLAVADEVSVADTLVRIASEEDAPAIVVGTSGVGGIKAVLLGSTARDAVRRAHCPVVLYRSPRPGNDRERRPARGE